ncbi:MAG: hypothetical protein LUE29_08170 [Lachnospiraceae bacterium]|nr:hypothetical protein [Lachnospiraceae bacterium]
MKENTIQEQSNSRAIGDASVLAYDMECATDLALCLSMAAGTGNVGEEQMCNALYALHNHLTDLCDRQRTLLQEALSTNGKRTTEKAA